LLRRKETRKEEEGGRPKKSLKTVEIPRMGTKKVKNVKERELCRGQEDKLRVGGGKKKK